jgi:hypothetical protein
MHTVRREVRFETPSLHQKINKLLASAGLRVADPSGLKFMFINYIAGLAEPRYALAPPAGERYFNRERTTICYTLGDDQWP